MMTEKQYDIIDKEEPRGQSVTYNGVPCTARTCVTRLNRLTEENEQLKKDLVRTKVVLDSLQETYSELLKIIPKG